MEKRILPSKRTLQAVLFILLLSVAGMAKAGPVDMNRAKQVGAKFLNASTSMSVTSGNDLQLAATYRTSNGTAAFHVFNAPQGWVIVAADNCATPILGYSTSGQFDENNLPPAMQEYLEGFVEQIEYGIESGLPALDTVAHQWELVQATGLLSENRSSNVYISPLLSTKWDQGKFYNHNCPEDPEGPDSHAYTGCVATAMAQIMNFWRWPEHGSGSHSYNASGYGIQPANFENTYYDWDNMNPYYGHYYDDEGNNLLLPEPSPEEITAVATLMYHCGVSVDMDYGSDESGAYLSDAKDAFINYFRYSSDANYKRKFGDIPYISDSKWKKYIREDLQKGYPILYKGQKKLIGSGESHAFVVDGINTYDYMHINWGWSGKHDGWFALGSMSPGNHSFNYYNGAVFNLHPNVPMNYTVTTEAICDYFPEETGGTALNNNYLYCIFPNTTNAYPHNSFCIMTAEPYEGYSFSRWTTEDGEYVSTSPTIVITQIRSDKHYIAHFHHNYYTIHATVTPEDIGPIEGQGIYYYGDTCTLKAKMWYYNFDHYHFVNWKKDGVVVSTDRFYHMTITGNANYVGTFAKNNYNITATADPPAYGAVYGAGNFMDGAVCNLRATANTGYQFVNWTKNGAVVSTNPNYSFPAYGTAQYVAHFAKKTFEITIEALPTESGSVTGGGTFNHGSTCTLHAMPSPNYYFVNWKKNGTVVSTNPTYSFTVTEPGTYKATFNIPRYQIAASVYAGGNGGVVTGGGTYNKGATCTLTAMANEGYRFHHWGNTYGGMLPYDSIFSFTVTEPKNFVAYFQKIPYVVTALPFPMEGGYIYDNPNYYFGGSNNYYFGETCTLTAVAHEGYHFINWTMDGVEVSTEPTYSFTVPSHPVNYQANFEITIALDTFNLQFDEFGTGPSAFHVSMSHGDHLQGEPTVNDVPDWITASISSDHSQIEIIVSENPSWESRTGSFTVSMDGYTSQPLVIMQSGCAPAWFYLDPTSFTLAYNDQSWHTVQATDVAHVINPNAPAATLSKIDTGDGTDWVTLGNWNANTKSFPFHLSSYASGTAPRSAKIHVIMTGSDGVDVARAVTINQNPSGASVAISPYQWDLGIVPMCIPETETFTVSYQDVDPAGYSLIRLEATNNGRPSSTVEISPDHYDIDPSGTGSVDFTVTYMTAQPYTDHIELRARLGHYGVPGLYSAPAILTAFGLHPYDINEKITSTEMFLSGPADERYVWDTDYVVDTLRVFPISIVSESLQVEASWMNYGEGTLNCTDFNPQFVSNNYSAFDLEDGTYLLYRGQAFLAWSNEENLHGDYIYLSNNIPGKYRWTISFDGDGNAIIRPYLEQSRSLRCKSHIISDPQNPDETQLVYFIECVTEGGTPVQIFRHIDGEMPTPILTSEAEYFMDGDSLTFTFAPVDNMGVVYSIDYGDSETSTEPVSFTVTETTKVSASSYVLCDTDPLPDQIEHTYFKIIPIAEARANAVEANNDETETCAIKGIVTKVLDFHSPNGSLYQIFMQDETGGICLDYMTYPNDPNAYECQEGDEVIFIGMPMYYEDNPNEIFLGMAEFGTKLSNTNTVEPFVKSIAELKSSNANTYLDMVVKVQNARVIVNPEYGDQYGLTDGENTMLFPMDPIFRDLITLNNGDIIDLTAIYTDPNAFIYLKEIVVKESRTSTLQAYDDETLNTPNPAWDGHLFYCDTEGNALTPSVLHSGDVIWFTIEDDYMVGLNEDLLPVAAVCNAETGEVLYDSYSNLLLSVGELGGVPNRLFAFIMPDTDVSVKVWLKETVVNYTVNVSANPASGGILSGNGIYAEGSTCTLTATVNEGYTFINWTKNGEEISTGSIFSFIVAESAIYVANFEAYPDTHAIAVIAAPETCGTVEGAGAYAEGVTCTLTATANEGCQFLNWTKDGVEVSTETSYNFTVTEDASFVAHFAEYTSTITVLANPNNGGIVSGDGTYNFGETATLTATAEEGYTFTNWMKGDSVVSTDATYSFNVNETTTYVANFVQDTYEIIATADPIEGGTVTGAGTYSHGEAITLAAIAAEDYTFTGWTRDGDTISTDAFYTFNVTEDAAFVANFALNSYTVTAFANLSYAGMVIGDGIYSPGETCTLTATAEIGFGFVNWVSSTGESVSTEATYSFTVTEDAMLVANFEEVNFTYYTITATVNPVEGGIIYDADKYAEGETCTLIAETYPGYTFVNWTRNGEEVSTELSYSFTVTEDADFVANFSGESVYLSIDASASPAEGGTISGNGSYAYGTTCTLIATANTNYQFVNWTENGEEVASEDSLSFLVFDDLTLVANFEVIPGTYYTISAIADPTEGGTVTGAGSYDHGETCTLTATANAGYTFINWTEDGEVITSADSYSFTVTRNRTLMANFEPITPPIVSEGLMAYYPFNGNANDASGNGYHATSCNNFQYEEGLLGQSIAVVGQGYTGSAGGHVLLPAYDFDITTGLTLSLWVKALSLSSSDGETYINFGNDIGANSADRMYIMQDPGHVKFVYNEGVITVPYQSSYTGTWVMYTLSCSPEGTLVAYVNGEMVGEIQVNYTAQWNTSLAALGRHWWYGGGTTSTRFTGSFDEVRIYNRPLSPLEVQMLYNNIEAYEILAVASPEEGGTVEGTGVYSEGSTCTLTATPNEGYTFLYWASNGVLLSTDPTYSFTVTSNVECMARFHFGNDDVQVSTSTSGWNWWNTYIEQEGTDGLAQLEESLGSNGIQIKSQQQYTNYYEGMGWMGMLSNINNESAYKIKTSAACIVEMVGTETTPEAHPITIGPGWNWIGYPVNASMSVTTAMSDITPANGDQVKAQNGYANYYDGMGWMGTLSTIEPGMGILYKSNGSGNFTLVYPDEAKGETLAQNITAENNHWVPNMHAYPDNMTVTAMVELDDVELTSGNYELAAFADGECRGSVRLMYIEPIDRYIAFLTIAGEDVTALSFGLYDTTTGEEIYDAQETLNFSNNAMVGDVREPYVIHFRGTTGTSDWASSLNVYPNPIKRGENINLSTTNEIGKLEVEIINALGIVVETCHGASLQSIAAPNVAGVYTLRISVEGKGTCYRKLVVK